MYIKDTVIWGFISVFGVPIFLAAVYSYFGPGLFADLAGATPYGLSLVSGDFLVTVFNPIVALTVFIVLVNNVMKLWKSDPTHSKKRILSTILLIVAALVCGIICFWKVLTT